MECLVCPNGHSVTAGNSFCTDCGVRLQQAVLPETSQPPRMKLMALVAGLAAVLVLAGGALVFTKWHSGQASADKSEVESLALTASNAEEDPQPEVPSASSVGTPRSWTGASQWIGTDANGTCGVGRLVTDAEQIDHPKYGTITLLVCGNRSDYNPDLDWNSADTIALIDDAGEIWWQADSSAALPMLRIPEVYQDVTGVVFLEYNTGGAHCCDGIIAIDPIESGFNFLSNYDFPNDNGAYDRFEGDGAGAILLPDPSGGPMHIANFGNTYEPSYAEGQVTLVIYDWDSDIRDFVENTGTQAQQCALFQEEYYRDDCPGYLLPFATEESAIANTPIADTSKSAVGAHNLRNIPDSAYYIDYADDGWFVGQIFDTPFDIQCAFFDDQQESDLPTIECPIAPNAKAFISQTAKQTFERDHNENAMVSLTVRLQGGELVNSSYTTYLWTKSWDNVYLSSIGETLVYGDNACYIGDSSVECWNTATGNWFIVNSDSTLEAFGTQGGSSAQAESAADIEDIFGVIEPGQAISFQTEGNGSPGWHIGKNGKFVYYYGGESYIRGSLSKLVANADGSYSASITAVTCVNSNDTSSRLCVKDLAPGMEVKLLPTKGMSADSWWFCDHSGFESYCSNGKWNSWSLLAPDQTIYRTDGEAFNSAWSEDFE